MEDKLTLRKNLKIGASANVVWSALIDPEKLKQTMFGCDIITDWKIGSDILFKGSWEGTEFVDKGIILDFQDGKSYEYSYWSNFSGLPDAPENYSIVKFRVQADGDETILHMEQSNFAKESMYEHSDKNWDVALNALKDLIEGKN